MNERQERFIDLLRQIFELNKADLDFGIYRILNIRRNEIEEFFTTRLPQKITETLQPFAAGNKENILKRLQEIESQLGNQIDSLPDNIPMVAEYKQFKQQLQLGTDISALESDVYSALYTFFSRYYDEGDFISKRRYKEGVYAIPYEGEEVKLYWANQDQYFIKTSENFKDYSFMSDGYTIHFRIVAATTEKNNNKEAEDKKRRFMLFVENEELFPRIKTFTVEGKEISIRFMYDLPEDPKVNYEETNLALINEWINTQPDIQLRQALLRIINPDAKADKRKTVIQKHLDTYIAKNSFDYFIHKDLRGFLSRELDFFIKNEVMHLDDLDTASEAHVGSYLAKVRAIKRVGKDIITFLDQLENFQKRLWLKKKFVVETNWCITLDIIPEKYYDEIRKNKAQIEEWKKLYFIQEIEPDLEHTEPFKEEPSLLFLQQNQNLIVNTKLFDENFTQRLISEFDNLDEKTNGLLINSENFQALELLYKKYAKTAKCIYIDPPYNIQGDGFPYKDNYKISSWTSMMNDRIRLGIRLLKESSCLLCSIGEDREGELRLLFNTQNFQTVIPYVWKSRAKPTNTGDAKLRPQIVGEFIYMGLNDANQMFLPITSGIERKYNKHDKWGNYRTTTILTSNLGRYKRETMRFSIAGYTPPADKRWKAGPDEIQSLYDTHRIGFNDDGEPFRKHYEGDEEEQNIPFWTYIPEDISGTAESGKAELSNYIPGHGFDTVKPKQLIQYFLNAITSKDDLVIDYFAGSGTTADAVIEQNEEENANRKYILVDSEYYFKTLILPRVKKRVYSPLWRDGKPLYRNLGISQCFKYITLEQYEDALNNIKLKADDKMNDLFGDDYTLQYMLDIESRDSLLNVKAFTTPFEYEMWVTENNEKKQRKVDVCETFNYLIGLTIIRQGSIQRYQTTVARNPEYEGAVDLVIDRQGPYQFRQIEGTLRDGQRVLIIWRNITKDLLASNAALDAYFTKYRINPRDREYDIIYVNGDSNIENLRTDNEHWKVERTEKEFNKRMFED